MISKIQITSEPSSLSSIEDYNEINQLRAIYVSAVEAVDPKRLIYDNLVFENNNLKYKNYTHEFSKPCYVVGFGKAVLGMALALDEILTDNILMGIVIVPVGTFTRFKNKPHMKPRKGTRIQYIEAGKDNIIDIHSVNATQKVINMVHNLKQDDLVLMLVSGGGSALLAMPNVQLHLKQKQELLIALSKAGADSKEINTVAKKLSRVKGGKLAEIIYPAEIICFILSDVIGDNLDFIASGPTMPCWDPPEGAVNVLKKYNLFSHLNKNIREVVFKDNIPSSIPIINSNFIHCHNVLVGSNRIAAEAAKTCAQNIGYATTILSNYVYGSVTAIAKIYAEMVELFSLIFKSEEGIEDDDLEERSKKLKPEKLIAQFLLKNRGAIGMNEKNIKDFENLKINGCRGKLQLRFLSELVFIISIILNFRLLLIFYLY